ncbi:NUDIX domain-containing protein, partial [Streptococcus agalactiae]|nr:NUDIX domain-containing protein [Streptococcus agalactiae]MCC9948172.1 NUDIX domain-containing protein [Streptococcus agalactiae]
MKNRDFRLREQLETFGVRVSALIIENQKLLLIYAPHLDKYYLPGGALQVGEDSNKAVAREVLEEIGLHSQVGDLAYIIENQFNIK